MNRCSLEIGKLHFFRGETALALDCFEELLRFSNFQCLFATLILVVKRWCLGWWLCWWCEWEWNLVFLCLSKFRNFDWAIKLIVVVQLCSLCKGLAFDSGLLNQKSSHRRNGQGWGWYNTAIGVYTCYPGKSCSGEQLLSTEYPFLGCINWNSAKYSVNSQPAKKKN